jgi:hypothetical protein
LRLIGRESCSRVASDVASLVHALQSGNANAISAALAALETTLNGSGGAASGTGSPAAAGHNSDFGAGTAASVAAGGDTIPAHNHHFEHLWHG